MIDLDFFCWRFDAQDADGPRLVVPYSDHWGSGDPINLIWATADEAIAWRDELISEIELECVNCGVKLEFHDGDFWHAKECPKHSACWSGDQGPTPEETPAEVGWKLVHYTGEVQ